MPLLKAQILMYVSREEATQANTHQVKIKTQRYNTEEGWHGRAYVHGVAVPTFDHQKLKNSSFSRFEGF